MHALSEVTSASSKASQTLTCTSTTALPHPNLSYDKSHVCHPSPSRKDRFIHSGNLSHPYHLLRYLAQTWSSINIC